jgi:DNA topoisomerase VI subunit A
VNVSGDVIGVNKLTRAAYCLPVWPEPENLQIVRCKAKGVLLVKNHSTFGKLVIARADKALNMILISASGIPRFSTRRFAHRLCEQFKLPLYVLADNDTWGYFMFSLMKRGAVDPAMVFPYAAVKDTRYIGMRCTDASHFENPKEVKIPQKSYWKYRIAAMRKYDCFKSKAWQQEFDAFEKQKGKFELGALIGRKGAEYVINEYLKPKLEQQDYLK